MADDEIDRAVPRLSRTVKRVATFVIALTVLAMIVDRRRERNGALLVQADGGALTITLRQGGRTVVSDSERRSFELLPGDYEVVPAGNGGPWRAVPRA